MGRTKHGFRDTSSATQDDKSLWMAISSSHGHNLGLCQLWHNVMVAIQDARSQDLLFLRIPFFAYPISPAALLTVAILCAYYRKTTPLTLLLLGLCGLLGYQFWSSETAQALQTGTWSPIM